MTSALDLTPAITAVNAIWKTVPGLRLASDNPPETALVYPFAATYEGAGDIDLSEPHSGTFAPQTAVLISELHLSDMSHRSHAIAIAMTFRTPFLEGLQLNPNLTAHVMNIERVRYGGIVPLVWNTVDTIGYRFEIEVVLELT